MSADKLSARAIPCVFLGFVPDATGWQFYHPTSRHVLPSQDATFDKSVPFYHPLPPQGPAPSGVSQVDPLPGPAHVQVAVVSDAAPGTTSGGAASGDAASGGAEPGGAGSEGAGSRGAEPEGVEPGGAESEGAEPGGAESEGAESGGAEPRGAASSGGPAGASPRVFSQQLREWLVQRAHSRSGAPGAGEPGDTGAGGAAVSTGAGDPTELGAAGAGGAGAGVARVGGPGAGGAGAAGAGAVDPRAGGAGGTVRPRPYFVPLLQQVLGVPSSTGLPPPFLYPPPDQSQPPLQPPSPLPVPSPYTEQSGGLIERREPASHPVLPIRTARRAPRSRPPPVPGTHTRALRPSSVPLRVPLPAPPESSLPEVLDPESDRARAASPTVSRLLASAVTDSSFESTAASALVAELLEFAAACRLDYASALVAESVPASPPSVGGECALGTDVVEDRQDDFECLAAAVPRFASLLLALEGDPDAPDISTPRSYAEAITGPYSSQLQAAMDAEMASWKSTGTYVDKVPPPGVNIVDGMWIFRVLLHVAAQRDYELHSLDFSTAFLQGSLHEEIWLRRPPGFTGTFPAADPSLFLRTDTSLPPFYVLVYVDDLVCATGDTEALTLVNSELQKRHTCTDLGELRSYLSLQITRDRARRTITLTHSHMVHQVLQRFGFKYSSPQLTPLSTSHSLSAPPSDESVEPSGPYPELVGCLMYLMTCTRPDLAYPLSLLARYVAPGRYRKVHWDAAKRVLRYLSSCEAEIYAGAMAAQELRWLTYLLTDLGEQPRSPPVLYVDNKAMIALCQEHRLEHRTKHIALRYFLARELQQRGQLRLAYVATRANTADVFTKALPPAMMTAVASLSFTLDYGACHPPDRLVATPPWPPVAPLPPQHGQSLSCLRSPARLSVAPLLAPPCTPCIAARLCATPHSSLRAATAPFQTLHLDVWGPAPTLGPERERYFLVVVDDYSRYTAVFPLVKKSDVTSTLIRWLLATEGTRGSRHWLGHGHRPHVHDPCPYAAHQLNLQPCVSRPEVSPTSLWTGSPGVGLAFPVWGCLALVRDTSADKLSACTIPCVFLGFPVGSHDYSFYHPPLHQFLNSRDVRFDESMSYYTRYPCRGLLFPPPPLFLAPSPPPAPAPPVPPAPPGPAPSVPLAAFGTSATGTVDSGGVGAGGAGTGGASSGGARAGGAGAGGASSGGAGAGGTGACGASSGGAGVGGAGAAGAGTEETGAGGATTGHPLRLPTTTTPSPTAYGPTFPLADSAPAVFSPPQSRSCPPVVPQDWTNRCPPRARPSSPLADLRTALFRSSPFCSPPVSVLPSPPESSLTVSSHPITDYYRAARLLISRVLASLVTDPRASPSFVSALTAAIADFASTRRLDYAACVVAAPPPRPLSVGGESAPGCDVLEDRPFELEFLAAASPSLCAMLLSLEGDLDALDIPTPRTYREAGRLHEEIWLRHPRGFTDTFPPGTQWSLGRPVYGLRQSPREWHDTLRSTLRDIGFRPSSADPSLFVHAGSTPFFILVYVDDLVFPTADRAALAEVKSKLQKRDTCTDLGELHCYFGLQITRDRAARTITLTQSHMVQQVLRRFGFQFSTTQPTPLAVDHRLSGPSPDEPFESSGPYAELVDCLMYLMTCTLPDLAFPLSVLSRFVVTGIHRPVHWTAAVRVAKYLATTTGMGLVLGGTQPVVLTGHYDSSYADDVETMRSTQGYCFSLGAGAVSWRSTQSSSVASSNAEAEIYAGAMAAQELRCLTFLLTDLGERPHSAPTLYAGNKAMILLCREPRVESRVKHIDVR
ncbi:unnamed protein product [Closterium sp. NIES-54]